MCSPSWAQKTIDAILLHLLATFYAPHAMLSGSANCCPPAATEFVSCCCPGPLCAAPLLSPARLSTSVARPQVQVVTHLCYSDFQDIMKAVDDMDGEGLTRTSRVAVWVVRLVCSI
jgi:hypothetical protein